MLRVLKTKQDYFRTFPRANNPLSRKNTTPKINKNIPNPERPTPTSENQNIQFNE